MQATELSSSFVTVLDDHKGIVFKIANAYCQQEEDRKDLIQEIIIQLWRSFSKYNDEFKYSTWIYRIALNTAISFYRKERKRKDVNADMPDEILHLSDANTNTEKEHQLHFLQQCIAELKELDKAIMILYLEEKSHKEIAGITGISETNVATKIGRIKQLLKQKFLQIKD